MALAPESGCAFFVLLAFGIFLVRGLLKQIEVSREVADQLGRKLEEAREAIRRIEQEQFERRPLYLNSLLHSAQSDIARLSQELTEAKRSPHLIPAGPDPKLVKVPVTATNDPLKTETLLGTEEAALRAELSRMKQEMAANRLMHDQQTNTTTKPLAKDEIERLQLEIERLRLELEVRLAQVEVAKLETQLAEARGPSALTKDQSPLHQD